VEKKRRVLVILAVLLCLVAAVFAVPLVVSADVLSTIAIIELLPSLINTTLLYVGLRFIGDTGALVILIVFLLMWASLVLIIRKAYHFWWMLPYSAVMYYTVFLISQLRLSLNTPPFLLERLSREPLIGLLFLILLFLLELTLGILFGYISNNLYKRYRKLHPRSQITPKAMQKVAVPKKERKVAKPKTPKEKQPSPRELRVRKVKARALEMKRLKEERKEARRLRREERLAAKHAKGSSSEKKLNRAQRLETDEEILVRIPREDKDGASDDPVTIESVHENGSLDSLDALDADAPLVFPEIKELPKFKTIRSKNQDREMPVSVVGQEANVKDVVQASDSILNKDGKIFVGSLKVMKDASVLLTETPVTDIEEQDSLEPELPKKVFNPMASLRQRMAKDAEASQMKVPVALPPQQVEQSQSPILIQSEEPSLPSIDTKQEVHQIETIAPAEVPFNVETPSLDTITPKISTTGQENNGGGPSFVPEASSQESGGFSDEDMEFLSGIGGLVSSNAGPSALLSRSKTRYNYPSEDLLVSYPDHSTEVDDATRKAGEALILTLKQFRIEATLINIVRGPTVTMFEVSPAPGVRVSAIVSLSDNIALQLAARQVRIVAPIPGKQAVGIEVPNRTRSIIGFREMLPTIDEKNYNIPMVLGRKITGEPVVIELTQTPHLLIAGATGSGKSVCVNSLISSILFRRSPKDVRLILVDPKIVELRVYNGIPHLLTPVITEAKKTIKALEFCLYEMDRRYKLLNALAVRNITAYNNRIREQKLAREKLPFIVVVIDEFADLMTTVGKELETLLARLAAMARAVGIHLVLATQRPSANVITGIIKSNIPTRIAFMVASQIDSRIIIDETGAEKLLGKGDLLFAPGWDPHSIRIQGAFLSDEEVERVVEYAKSQGEPDYLDEMFFEDEDSSDDSSDGDDGFGDDVDDVLMEKALKIVVERQSASASYLQRRLKIGYNRAARLVEQMEDDGYVGPARGSKPRELLRYPD
jgi:DNA segregation ATPase FtsK/SpoIIIE, S-DNA-T family